MVIFHCYVSLPEGIPIIFPALFRPMTCLVFPMSPTPTLPTRPGRYRGAAEDAADGGAALYGSSAGVQGDVPWSREMSPASISMKKTGKTEINYWIYIYIYRYTYIYISTYIYMYVYIYI